MVFGSVFEVSFRASAVFLCFLDRKHRRYRRYMKGSMGVVKCFNDCSVFSD